MTVSSENQPEDAASMMQIAVDAKDWARAEEYSKNALIENPNDPDVMTQVAVVAAFRDRKREAANLLAEAARMANYNPATRVDQAVQALAGVGEVYTAISLLEESVTEHPDRDDQRMTLVGFWNEVQRTEQIPRHLKTLIKNRQFNLPLLLTTTETSSRRLSEKTAERLMALNPQDHRVRLSEAFLLLYRGQSRKAAAVLKDIIDNHPDFAPAQAMHGYALATTAKWEEFVLWLEEIPASTEDYADYWLAMGDYALMQGRADAATRSFWEATRRDPNRAAAWERLRLAASQMQQGDSSAASNLTKQQLQTIAEHSTGLLAVTDSFNEFTSNGSESQRAAAEVARNLLSVGRVWEAEAWSAFATTLQRDVDPNLATLREQIVSRLRKDASWFARDTPAFNIDCSKLPVPELASSTERGLAVRLIPKVLSHDHLKMSERSDPWGLSGIGDGNDPSDPRVAPLIRSTGAGGGSIDYDLDGWPDLVTVNAGGTILKLDSLPDQLLRNLGERFVDVSDLAGLNSKAFGQGLAVGDFNEDGFPDFFIANFGRNQLLRNNGDGTFTDCTEQLLETGPERWSTSAAFVDINNDAIADLVFTNYCQSVPELEQPCPKKDGTPGPCHPMRFPGDVDQFFVGTSEGTLVDSTSAWVGQPVAGRGLGVLAGKLDHTRLGIFVANDMTRNSYYAHEDATSQTLVDSGAARGLAVDGRSLTQASMGIAASDFDHDGDLDLYVTGFGREYNIYYEQAAPGIWNDETAKMNLIDPTLMWVGFGTQAIDLDSDGLDEIIVTNGNIGKFSDPGADVYEQPMQVFRRTENGTFGVVDDDAWGDYFSQRHVGRALWTSDVNRDGRNDVLVTHTRKQIGLLVNECSNQNQRIGFRLVATNCSRDGVGAVVRFQVNGQPRAMWMLAGDGYLCSNEKTLIAGLGESKEITDVTVTWQDGSIDRIDRLDANRQYLVVQGSGEAFPMMDYPSTP
ncbi:MAG: FG-GAP-like repeat-containing protein [Planctomycetota bacterium]